MSQATSANTTSNGKSRLFNSIWFNLLLMLGIVALCYFIFFSSLGLITHHGAEIKVPKVLGKDVKSAIALLEGQGFDVHVDSTYAPDKKALVVLDQIPDAGEIVKNGRTLFITVNKSVPPTTPMPNLVNLSFRSAALILKSNKLILGDTTYRPDIAQGAILEQLLNGQPIRPGQMIPQGSIISLVIGDGLGNTEMNVPDVIGMTYPEAVAQLSSSGLMFTPIFDGDISDTTAAKIYKQTPNAISDLGTPSRIRQGDFIDLYVGQNPADSTMEANRNAWKDNLYNSPPNTGSDDTANQF
ncbi:MAG: PASTA domain-containing protein [Bacteroidetes bacterium]|nr:PASTA domain-containing protein [Bacteroidota bacterium]